MVPEPVLRRVRASSNNFHGFAPLPATQLRLESLLECTGGDFGNLGEVAKWEAHNRCLDSTNDLMITEHRLISATVTVVPILMLCLRKMHD